MKPNKKQIEVSKLIENLAKKWQNTEDISHQAHINAVGKEMLLTEISADLNEGEAATIENMIVRIYAYIRDLR